MTDCHSRMCAQCSRCHIWVVMLPPIAERIEGGTQATCPNLACRRPGTLNPINTFPVTDDSARPFLLPRHVIKRGYFFESEIDSWGCEQ